jgi:hypothetical protein
MNREQGWLKIAWGTLSGGEARQNVVVPDNRRACRRVPLVTHVEALADGRCSIGYSRDISTNGLSVDSHITFSPPAEIRIRLHLPPYPPGTPMQIRGVVVWAEPGVRMGIAFLNLNREQQIAIDRFIHLHGRITEVGLL